MQDATDETNERARTARWYAALLLLASCAAPVRDASEARGSTSSTAAQVSERNATPAAPVGASIWQDVPGTAFRFELAAIPPDAARGIAPFWLARTELTWDAFDAWTYRDAAGAGAANSTGVSSTGADSAGTGSAGASSSDAISRPTQPYLPPDRGFGHAGYAAISITAHNAAEFCRWLSHVSGRRYRLPTEAEWEHACRAGASGAYSFGDDATELERHAWYAANSNGKAQRVATKLPNAWGLYDMHGNAQEWCVGADGAPITRGGSWRDAPAALRCAARVKQPPAWNASDPNLPKSRWWLPDAPFVGFRVLCESP